MKSFQYAIPTKIYFGTDTVQDIGKISKTFGSKVMLVLGKSTMEQEGVAHRVVQSLESEGLSVQKFEGVETNPKMDKLLEGIKLVKMGKPKAIIGLGGGSTIDTAKAISLGATHEGNLWEYRLTGKLGISKIEDKLIPIITVPTAFGTGSEITPASVIVKDSLKEVIVSPFMFPRVALIDPMLSISLSPELTARIGCDAFIQAMEAFASTDANPMSDIFAIEALRLSFEWLPKCVHEGRNIEARTRVALAALYGGFSIVLAGVGAVHALAAPLSGKFDIHHGYALSILLIQVMKHNLGACTARYAQLAEILGVDIKNIGQEQAARQAIARTQEFLESLGLFPPKKLREFGIKVEDLKSLAKESLNPDMTTNPKKMSAQEIIEIFQSIL